MKKFLTKLLFSKKQREIIWQALIFSEYKYRCRGNVDKAVEVQFVLEKVYNKLGVAKSKFTKQEVLNIVKNLRTDLHQDYEKKINNFMANINNSVDESLKKAYNEGYKAGAIRELENANKPTQSQISADSEQEENKAGETENEADTPMPPEESKNATEEQKDNADAQ